MAIKNKNIAPDANISVTKTDLATSTTTFTNKTLTAPVLSGSVTGTYTLAGTPTVTSPTITGATLTTSTLSTGTLGGDLVHSETKRCSTATTATSTTTLANITGLTGFTLTAAGVYEFEIDLQTTMTINGGLGVALKFTTATLTSIQCQSTAFAAAAVAQGAQNTTTTDADLKFNSKAAAYLRVIVKGTLVVNVAGTVAVQMAQETSHIDTTTVLVGSTARFTRLS